MASDARISIGLPDHPKTKKLIRRFGDGAAWRLVRLFLWAASNRSDGDLTGLTNEDIELAVDWSDQENAFVNALVEVGFLDGEEGAYKIHDWAEHNPWAAGANDRSEASKWAALCKRYGRDGAAKRMPEYAERMRPACDADAEECDPHTTGKNPQCPDSVSVSVTDTNSETDKPIVDGKPSTPVCPHQEIIELYHELCPTMPKVKIHTEARRKALQARWRESPKHQSLDFWRSFFDYASSCPLLRGERGEWRADFEWLVTAGNFAKVIEGKYEDRSAA